MPQGLWQRATSGRDLLSLDSTSPSCQDGSRLAKEHKASVPSGLLGIFSAKSPISPEQNPRGWQARRRWELLQHSCCYPLVLCNRFLFTVAPRSLQKGFGKPHLCSQDIFSFASFPSEPTGPSCPSSLSLSWCPACKCPQTATILLGSHGLPALPHGFFPPKVFLPLAH